MDHLQDRWLSIKEICAYLGVSDDTVYRWIKFHDMPTHKMGRLWKFKINEIDERKVDMFIDNPIEHIEVTSSERNVFSSQGIDVKLGTVHSVKGQTHTATLFLECFNDGFNANQLIEHLTGNPADKVKGVRNKKSALKIAYVAMSRPTHFLCAAFHIDRIPTTAHKKLEDLGWSLVTI